jgi:hypothetical protein
MVEGSQQPLGRPKPKNVKFSSSVELIAPLAEREQLDDATKAIRNF